MEPSRLSSCAVVATARLSRALGFQALNRVIQSIEDLTLYIFSGLPGSGKTTLSQAVASRIGAAHLRIDTIEQALRELCSVEVQGEGYRLAYRVAGDILRSGVSVTADSCNPIELTRREWEQVARNAGGAPT